VAAQHEVHSKDEAVIPEGVLEQYREHRQLLGQPENLGGVILELALAGVELAEVELGVAASLQLILDVLLVLSLARVVSGVDAVVEVPLLDFAAKTING
jgi:hypothetical protein